MKEDVRPVNSQPIAFTKGGARLGEGSCIDNRINGIFAVGPEENDDELDMFQLDHLDDDNNQEVNDNAHSEDQAADGHIPEESSSSHPKRHPGDPSKEEVDRHNLPIALSGRGVRSASRHKGLKIPTGRNKREMLRRVFPEFPWTIRS